jgi:tetratricopeptide (TPR) repeat protein
MEIADAIHGLEARLASTPLRSRPYEHAVAAYRLGLAYSESPNGDRTENLRRALLCYELAAGIFDPRFDPVEHARVLNATGAARRALGDLEGAAGLFEQAAGLLEGRGQDAELAAALNNLGLARTELGEVMEALQAFDRAAATFDPTTAEGRRSLVATLHNRGQAFAASGTMEGLVDALEDYALALEHLDPVEAPYHYGLVQHSIGTAAIALADLQPEQRITRLQQASVALGEALGVFSRSAFPFQHALAKHNLGLAWSALGGEAAQRHALVCFEDSVAVLDPRLHGGAWKQAYASLARVESELAGGHPGWTRTDHFVTLAAEVDAEERVSLLRERLGRLLALPGAARDTALVELAASIFTQSVHDARTLVGAALSAVMELPSEAQEPLVQALMDARNRLEPDAQEAVDHILDGAVGDALDGPQRILVRDYMYSMGFVRP